jgi:hypothetical protein
MQHKVVSEETRAAQRRGGRGDDLAPLLSEIRVAPRAKKTTTSERLPETPRCVRALGRLEQLVRGRELFLQFPLFITLQAQAQRLTLVLTVAAPHSLAVASEDNSERELAAGARPG